jgi:hypothetical protein
MLHCSDTNRWRVGTILDTLAIVRNATGARRVAMKTADDETAAGASHKLVDTNKRGEQHAS